MRGRRKKSRYTWFPALGSVFASGDVSYAPGTQFQSIIPELADWLSPTIGNGSLAVFPIVPDFTTFQTNTASNSLRDVVEGQDWLLKRLVGKAHVWLQTGAPSSEAAGITWPLTLVTLAFFVARANDEAQSECALADEEVDPMNVFNQEQPWIWRRTWMLGSLQAADLSHNGSQLGNNNNGRPVADGPHIDSKVARRIRKEQRLWGVLGCMGISGDYISVTGTKVQQPRVQLALDLRILGGMRRAHNVSAF